MSSPLVIKQDNTKQVQHQKWGSFCVCRWGRWAHLWGFLPFGVRVVRGAELSAFSNDCNPGSWTNVQVSYHSNRSLSVGVCDFWVMSQWPHQQRNVFETCISNKHAKSNEEVHHYIQCPTLIPALGCFRPVSQSCRHNSRMFTSSFGAVERLSLVAVFSLVRCPIQDDFKSSKEFFPDAQS